MTRDILDEIINDPETTNAGPLDEIINAPMMQFAEAPKLSSLQAYGPAGMAVSGIASSPMTPDEDKAKKARLESEHAMDVAVEYGIGYDDALKYIKSGGAKVKRKPEESVSLGWRFANEMIGSLVRDPTRSILAFEGALPDDPIEAVFRKGYEIYKQNDPARFGYSGGGLAGTPDEKADQGLESLRIDFEANRKDVGSSAPTPDYILGLEGDARNTVDQDLFIQAWFYIKDNPNLTEEDRRLQMARLREFPIYAETHRYAIDKTIFSELPAPSNPAEYLAGAIGGLAGFGIKMGILGPMAAKVPGLSAGQANLLAWEGAGEPGTGVGAAQGAAVEMVNALPGKGRAAIAAKKLLEGALFGGWAALQGGDAQEIIFMTMIPAAMHIPSEAYRWRAKYKAADTPAKRAKFSDDLVAEAVKERKEADERMKPRLGDLPISSVTLYMNALGADTLPVRVNLMKDAVAMARQASKDGLAGIDDATILRGLQTRYEADAKNIVKANEIASRDGITTEQAMESIAPSEETTKKDAQAATPEDKEFADAEARLLAEEQTPTQETSNEPSKEVQAQAEAVKQPSPVGESRTVMGQKATVAASERIDGIDYELYDANGKGIVRVYDADAGEVVSITGYDSISEAKAKYDDAIKNLKGDSKPPEAPPATPVVPEQPIPQRELAAKSLLEAGFRQEQIDANFALLDAVVDRLIADKKITSPDDVYALIRGGEGEGKTYNQFDLFGRESYVGEQGKLKIDPGKIAEPKADGKNPAKPELVKAILKIIEKSEKGKAPKDAKDAYLRLKGELKADADGLFNNRANPLPEMQDAWERATKGERLFQKDEDVLKAKITFTDAGKALIKAMQHADESSLAHETGHFLLNLMELYYPEEAKVVRRIFNVTRPNWRESQHERFTRAWSRYLRDGKAPVPELRPVFEKFKQWLESIYRTLFQGKMSNDKLGISEASWRECKRIFDRWLGKDVPPEDIEAATAERMSIKEAHAKAKVLTDDVIDEMKSDGMWTSEDELHQTEMDNNVGDLSGGSWKGDLPGEVRDIVNELSPADKKKFYSRVTLNTGKNSGTAEEYVNKVGAEAYVDEILGRGRKKSDLTEKNLENARQFADATSNAVASAKLDAIDKLRTGENIENLDQFLRERTEEWTKKYEERFAQSNQGQQGENGFAPGIAPIEADRLANRRMEILNILEEGNLTEEQVSAYNAELMDIYEKIGNYGLDEGPVRSFNQIDSAARGPNINKDLITVGKKHLADLMRGSEPATKEKWLESMSKYGKKFAHQLDLVWDAIQPTQKAKPLPGQDGIVSARQAHIDAERSAEGKPPLPRISSRSWEEANEIAMDRVKADPLAVSRLVDSLIHKPHAIDDIEHAMILFAKTKANESKGRLLQEGIDAYESGDLDKLANIKIQTAMVNADIDAINKALYNAGSIAGRALNYRKSEMAEDFSLVRVEQEYRAANNYQPLPDSKIAEIKALTDKVAKLQAEYDAYVAKAQAQLEAAAKASIGKRARAEVAKERKAERLPKGFSESNTVFTIEKANAAKARLMEKLGRSSGPGGAMRTSANLDPTILADVAEIVGMFVEGGIRKSAQLIRETTAFLGEKAKELHPYIVSAAKSAAYNEKPEPTPADIGAKMATRYKKGNNPLTMTSALRDLERMFVRQGITEPNAMIDAVNEVLMDAGIELPRRDIADALSGYGKYRPLSKDEIEVKVRDINGQLQQLRKLEDMASGEPPKKTGFQRREVSDAERALIKLVNDAKREGGYGIPDPETQLKSAVQALKTRWTHQLTDLNEQIARGDFARKQPKKPVELDPEASRLKLELEKAKDAIRKGQAELASKNRTKADKVLDFIVKWRRGYVLSSPVVFAKLTSAAVQRMVFTPMEELVGMGLSKLPGVRDVASRAAGEAPSSFDIEIRAFAEGFSKMMGDIAHVMKHGEMDIGTLYGKKHYDLAPSFMDYIGRLHAALKTVPKRAAFTRSLALRTDAAARAGLDITDPMVQMRLSIEAYKDGNRAIFMVDNWLTSRWRIATQVRIDKETGNPTLRSKALHTAARFALPVVNVPTNIVAETLNYTLGSAIGGAKVAYWLAKGIKGLKTEEADIIMRQLKKGSVGLFALALGYYGADSIGGYYQPGEKRRKGDVQWGDMRIFGITIPKYLLHNPLLMTMQLGATIRRVAESKVSRTSRDTRGFVDGMATALLGLLEDVPFVKETIELSKLYDQQRNSWFGEQVKSWVIPQAVDFVARQTDRSGGEAVKRDPKTVVEHIKTGIPGLRQTVKKKARQ